MSMGVMGSQPSSHNDRSRSETNCNIEKVVIAQEQQKVRDKQKYRKGRHYTGTQQVRDKLQYRRVVIAQGQQQVRDKLRNGNVVIVYCG